MLIDILTALAAVVVVSLILGISLAFVISRFGKEESESFPLFCILIKQKKNCKSSSSDVCY